MYLAKRMYLGIDPGKSGAIAAICENGFIHGWIGGDATEHDVAEWIASLAIFDCSAVIEKVHSSPQMGVKSAFTFGQSYGFLRGILASARIPYTEISPQRWQKAMQCLTKGDKNVTKAAAQRRWPKEKITHRNADALLLAEYGRTTTGGHQ